MNSNDSTRNYGAQSGLNWRDHSGRFMRGNPGKVKGSVTNQLREKIRSFLSDKWEELPDWLSQLEPREKIRAIIDLLPYAVPRIQAVDLSKSEITNTDNEGPKLDYSKLSESALKEVLEHTTNDNEE